MDFEWQPVINLALGTIIAAIGWFARQVWDSVQNLKRDIKQIEVDLPTHYVRKDDLQESMKRIERMFERIFEKLDSKADK
jgi:predicted negative regulator of RcsB-dependent stress response